MIKAQVLPIALRLLSTVPILGALCLPAPTFAEAEAVTKVAERIAVELRRQFGTSEQLDTVITKTYGVQLSREKAEVARHVMRTLLFNEAVPQYVAKLLVPVYRPDITQKEMASAVVEGIAQMQVKGLARLPPERQAAFVVHMVSMSQSIAPAACKAMFLGQLDTNASVALERRYIANLPVGKFEAISNLYKDAAEAELAGYPDARVINQQQAKLAEKVFEAASIRRLRVRVPQAVIQRVNEGVDSAQPAEVCAVLSAKIGGMLDMDEPYKSWQLTRFMQSMQ